MTCIATVRQTHFFFGGINQSLPFLSQPIYSHPNTGEGGRDRDRDERERECVCASVCERDRERERETERARKMESERAREERARKRGGWGGEKQIRTGTKTSEREALMEVIKIISIIASHFRRVSSPFAS
jgi:hypothetical protein